MEEQVYGPAMPPTIQPPSSKRYGPTMPPVETMITPPHEEALPVGPRPQPGWKPEDADYFSSDDEDQVGPIPTEKRMEKEWKMQQLGVKERKQVDAGLGREGIEADTGPRVGESTQWDRIQRGERAVHENDKWGGREEWMMVPPKALEKATSGTVKVTKPAPSGLRPAFSSKEIDREQFKDQSRWTDTPEQAALRARQEALYGVSTATATRVPMLRNKRDEQMEQVAKQHEQTSMVELHQQKLKKEKEKEERRRKRKEKRKRKGEKKEFEWVPWDRDAVMGTGHADEYSKRRAMHGIGDRFGHARGRKYL